MSAPENPPQPPKPEVKEEKKEVKEEKPKEEEESKVTEGLIALKRGIFNPSKRKIEASERFEASPQEYLEKHKIAVYLQDAIKILIERKDERPNDLLCE